MVATVLKLVQDCLNLELPAKTVLLHPDRHRAGHPEGVSQPCIPAFRQARGPTKLARLRGAQIKPAVFEKLPNAAEAALVTRLGDDGQEVSSKGNGIVMPSAGTRQR